MAFRTLLYRYFFFGWLFRDATRGNLFERAAAWRHNQAQAHWLPTYMRRWLVVGLMLCAAGELTDPAACYAGAESAFRPAHATTMTAFIGTLRAPGT